MMPEELAEARKMQKTLEGYAGDLSAQVALILGHALKHIDSQEEEIKRLLIELSDLRQLHGQKSIDMMQQAEVIRELNMENARIESGWNSDIDHYEKERKKTHATIKKLGSMVRVRGKALVEERADAIQQTPNRMTRDQATTRAREQLRAEGVII